MKAFGWFAAPVLIAAALLASVGAHEASAGRYGMAGCGLGSQLFTDNTKGQQILAATTNDFSGWTKLSAMSSGTSNCTRDGVALEEHDQEVFAEVNLDDLASDAAAGRGEHVTAFAVLLGCSADVHGAFAAALQANYGEIFPASHVSASEVLRAAKDTVRSDSALAGSCSRI